MTLYTVFQYTHNMWVFEAGDRLCLFEKILQRIISKLYPQYFKGRLCLEVSMFTEVDIGEASPSEETSQVIVAKLLSHTINHHRYSLAVFCFYACIFLCRHVS